MKLLHVNIGYFDNQLNRPLSSGNIIGVSDERAEALLKVKDGYDRPIVKIFEGVSTNVIYAEDMQVSINTGKSAQPATPVEELKSPLKSFKAEEPKKEETKVAEKKQPKFVYDKKYLSGLGRLELQKLAKSLGIKANQKNDALIKEILNNG